MRRMLLLLTLGTFLGFGGCNQSAPPATTTQSEPTADEREAARIEEALGQLSDEDRALAEVQKVCPVSMEALGSMGSPIKMDVQGQPLFICCEGCRQAVEDAPEEMLAKLKQ